VDLIVLKAADQDTILAFERARAELSILDPMERELQSWKARWRPEQLTHYLALGWSFGAWDEGRLIGYVLTQPFLFFRGLTQTLWVEHLSYTSPEIGEALIESVCKWARDKHFQTVLISELPQELKLTRKVQPFSDRISEITTSRLV
jgi:predicted N-acetyltransferase YhbS